MILNPPTIKANKPTSRLLFPGRPILVVTCLLLVCNSAIGQRRAVAVAEVAIAKTQEDGNSQDSLEGEDKYAGGAPLKTDPDLMDRLKKADQFRQDGNFRVAAKLWQSVLAESGDILFTNDKETYFALTEMVESILAELPESGLNSYRISADASAREILASAADKQDVEVLNRVVKEYFMSSFGDDAAYQLACIYLDRYDFVGAVRLLQKIVDQYPDPSVAVEDVWLRIAIARAYVGDRETATEALNKASESGADPDSRLFQSVQAILKEDTELTAGAARSDQWTTRFGNERRIGAMPGLPPGYDSQDLLADWQYVFSPVDKYAKDQYLGTTVPSFNPDEIKDTVTDDEKTMVKAWRSGNWRPAGDLLFCDNKVVFKTGADVAVWDRQQPGKDPVWRPLWLNQFTVDDATALWKQMYQTYGSRRGATNLKGPNRTAHIQLFGDKIAQSMTVHQGVLYNIEGKRYSWSGRPPRSNGAPNFQYGSIPRRTRTNRLSAYDVDTGKILWRIPQIDLLTIPDGQRALQNQSGNGDDADPETDRNKYFEDIGFMSAPAGFGDLLLVPVNVSGSIWLYALDSQHQGKLVWRSYLCDEPGGGSKAWSPIHVSLDGSTAYVNCGSGVVFAVDAMTGGIRFAKRYVRSGKANNFLQRFGGNAEVLELDGWTEDVVVPVGKELIVFASDYNAVWAIDRQTTRFSWKTDNRPFGNKFDYLIGITDEHIYIGGPKSVAAIRIKGQGRWEWVHSFSGETSFGRAMLTESGIYVPLSDRIVKLALKSDKGSAVVLEEIQVRTGTDAPLGNLYSDGQRIWVVSANRLIALGPDDGSIPDSAKKSKPEKESKQQDTEQSDGTMIVD